MLHTNDTAKCCILFCSLLSTTFPLFQVNESCVLFVVECAILAAWGSKRIFGYLKLPVMLIIRN